MLSLRNHTIKIKIKRSKTNLFFLLINEALNNPISYLEKEELKKVKVIIIIHK